MKEKVLKIIEDIEDYAHNGEEYPDAEMLLDWAKELREAIAEE